MQATDSKNKVVYWGTGRRKSAVAAVRLVPGTGAITVNGRDGETHFNRIPPISRRLKLLWRLWDWKTSMISSLRPRAVV